MIYVVTLVMAFAYSHDLCRLHSVDICVQPRSLLSS